MIKMRAKDVPTYIMKVRRNARILLYLTWSSRLCPVYDYVNDFNQNHTSILLEKQRKYWRTSIIGIHEENGVISN